MHEPEDLVQLGLTLARLFNQELQEPETRRILEKRQVVQPRFSADETI